MKRQKVIFEEEVYGVTSIMEYIRTEVLPYVPFWTMLDLKHDCDIALVNYGFVHDTGFSVVITQHDQNREGTGWTSIDHDYQVAMSNVRDRWAYADGYGYH